MRSLQGSLLVAVPQLPDPNFFRTVVLVIQHDAEGAFGVVLNRPTRLTLAEVWERAAEGVCRCVDPLYLGGPVEGPLLALHTQPDCSENEVLPGVYFATQRSHLYELVERNKPPFRVFSGYSGWAPGQLDGELRAGGWLTLPAEFAHVFSDPDDMWKQVAGQIGLAVLPNKAKAKHIPPDATLN